MPFGWLIRLPHCAGPVTSITNVYRRNKKGKYCKSKSNINTSFKSPNVRCLLSLPTANLTSYQSYIANVAGIESLGHTEPAQTISPARTEGHVPYYPNERRGIVDTFQFISDVNFAFRDVSRVPRLLLAKSNSVYCQHKALSATFYQAQPVGQIRQVPYHF